MSAKESIFEGFRNIVLNIAGVRSDENVLIVSEMSIDSSIAEAFVEVAQDIGAETAILMCSTIELDEELPKMIATALIGADVVFDIFYNHLPFSRSRAAWRAMYEYGTRMIHIDPPHRASLASNAAKVDCGLISNIARKLLQKTKRGKTLHITSKSGTDFTYFFDPEKINASYRFPINLGSTTIPLGLFVLHPVDEMSSGTLVFDAMDGFTSPLKEPIRLFVKKNWISKVEGGDEGEWIRKALSAYERSNYLVELGIGINPFVPLKLMVGERCHEAINRTAGLVHVGIGSSYFERRSKGFHSHLAIFDPTVKLVETGEIIVDEGNLKVLEEPEIKDEISNLGLAPSRE